ncbi:MAG: protein kinase [Blastopirellula sp.]|nr:MAG: protein kinase [Blastopirellula sp.]
MNYEPTEKQSTQDLKAAEDLSRQRTRPPREIPGYDLERFLGAGAYGEVWVGTAKNTGRRVAIKFYLHRSASEDESMAREVEKLVFLSADRYVVQLLEVGWNSDPAYYVMEYVENGSLQDRLKRGGPLPIDEAVSIFRDVVTGLLHAHAKGILHCDLKPANILLDLDGKARLADFGQSRLTHEQKPALGTLFYMAPEQADLDAVPDAAWDVYALGALLFTMLTGRPPYRTDATLEKIDSAEGLIARLSRYRELIAQSPEPVGHRDVKGIDRELIEVIDRQLCVNPKSRYVNVQEVIDALNEREQSKYRRPLVVLGMVGPAVLMAIMFLFGWVGYRQALVDSEKAVATKTYESNRFAAELAATNVAHEIEKYFDATERLTQDEDFLNQLEATYADEQLAALLAQLYDSSLSEEERAAARTAFQRHKHRNAIQLTMENQLLLPGQSKVASWFVTDDRGTHIASAFSAPSSTSPVGGYYGWRTYFHGQDDDLPKETRESLPITKTHLSAVFRSTATNAWKVAISTPVQRDGKIIGVVALTVDIGNFPRFKGSGHQFAALVDGRLGERRGALLQHPLFDEVLKREGSLPDRFGEYRAALDQMTTSQSFEYQDPLGADPLGASFDKDWIAAAQPVMLILEEASVITEDIEPSKLDTGLVIIVQEDRSEAISPIHDLGNKLVTFGIIALSILVFVVAVLWYFVLKVWKSVPGSTTMSADTSVSADVHYQTTVMVPQPPKQK